MPDGTKLRFYTAEQLGVHQFLTPEGFLLCKDVPIARVGTMLYAQGEVPVNANRDGIIRIHRDPEEVFSPMSMSSFNGKPVTDDHPPEKVKPGNWKVYSIGTTIDPHRGDGVMLDDDFLYADLLIQDEDAIRDVRQGKREVSAGYDAEYEEIEPGEGRQHLIVGNHVALVDKGRCGPRCMIGDSAMAGQRRVSVSDAIMAAARDRIMRAYLSRDESALVDELDKVGTMLGDILSGATESGGTARVTATTKADQRTSDFDAGGTHVHIHAGGARDDDEPDPAALGAAAGAGAGAAGAGADPDAGAGGGGDISEVLERLEALERAVAILAQQAGGEGGGAEGGENVEEGEPGSGEAEDDPEEDRAMARDQEGAGFQPADKPTGAGSKENVSLDRRRASVGDSASLKLPWQEVVSRAEVLVPGIKYPTFDARASAKYTVDAMCNFRRKALKEAMQEDDTRNVIMSINGKKPDLKQMTCDAVQLLFNGASDNIRQRNGRQTSTFHDTGGGMGSGNAGLQSTVAEINRKNRERYGIKA